VFIVRRLKIALLKNGVFTAIFNQNVINDFYLFSNAIVQLKSVGLFKELQQLHDAVYNEDKTQII